MAWSRPLAPTKRIRQRHAQWAREEGTQALHKALALVDPELAGQVHPNDLLRISRGLEVWELSGKKFSQWQQEHQFRTPALHALKIALVRPRQELYARVEARVDRMIEAGLAEECAHLVQAYGPQAQSLGSLGYKQMVDHLVHGVPLEQAIKNMKQFTRRYAKSQLNWLRSEPHMHWVKAPVLLGEEDQLPADVARDLRRFFEEGIELKAPAWAGAQALGYAKPG